MKLFKRVVIAAAIAALAVGSLSANAGRIGASSTSSASRSSASYSAPSSSRIGASTSSNYSHPASSGAVVRSYGDVNRAQMRAATAAPTTRYVAPSTTYVSPRTVYVAPQTVVRPGYSGGTVAATALAAGAIGYAAGAAGNHGPVIVNNQPGYVAQPAYGAPGYVEPAPTVAYGSAPAVAAPAQTVIVHHTSSFGSVLFGILAVVVVVLAVFFACALVSRGRDDDYQTVAVPNNDSDEDEEMQAHDFEAARHLLNDARGFYQRLQDANNRCDEASLANMVTVGFLPAVLDDIHQREGAPGNMHVVEVEVVGDKVLNLTREEDYLVGTIHYLAVTRETLNAPIERVSELWHFRRPIYSGRWQLDGIESA